MLRVAYESCCGRIARSLQKLFPVINFPKLFQNVLVRDVVPQLYLFESIDQLLDQAFDVAFISLVVRNTGAQTFLWVSCGPYIRDPNPSPRIERVQHVLRFDLTLPDLRMSEADHR
jgi:hypothetical protein